MTVAREIVTAAILGGLAIGAASTAWARPLMNGHYTETSSGPNVPTTNMDWYFTPCGDGCASVATASGGQPIGQARLANGQWTLDGGISDTACPDGVRVPNAESTYYAWDQDTLAGTVQNTLKAPACGNPVGFKWTNTLQLKQAP
jgi:hypothetical protein